MSPGAQSDKDGAPGSVDEGVPVAAAVVEDVSVKFEDAVAEPVVAHELPEVLHGVQSEERAGTGNRVMLAGKTSFLVVRQPA